MSHEETTVLLEALSPLLEPEQGDRLIYLLSRLAPRSFELLAGPARKVLENPEKHGVTASERAEIGPSFDELAVFFNRRARNVEDLKQPASVGRVLRIVMRDAL